MHTEKLLEACLQALSSGQEIPPDITRYLARHPEKRAEVEELILIAQRSSQLPPAGLSQASRERMQKRLAAHIGVDPAILGPGSGVSEAIPNQENRINSPSGTRMNRWRLLSADRLHVARLPFTSTVSIEDEEASARIRKAFRDLTREDIRRYIGDRGEDYLYYRQRFPRWEPVFAVLAAVMRGFKRLEKLADLY